ncbi:MAG: tetratricopeptide repeat protein [Patescibacteria group bacterium]|nr:tetratricopeptide repeat protein [Patescibacteria group bacterium]
MPESFEEQYDPDLVEYLESLGDEKPGELEEQDLLKALRADSPMQLVRKVAERVTPDLLEHLSLYEKARVHQAMGETDDAINDYQEALEALGESASPLERSNILHNLGLLFLKKHPKTAEDLFQQSIELHHPMSEIMYGIYLLLDPDSDRIAEGAQILYQGVLNKNHHCAITLAYVFAQYGVRVEGVSDEDLQELLAEELGTYDFSCVEPTPFLQKITDFMESLRTDVGPSIAWFHGSRF